MRINHLSFTLSYEGRDSDEHEIDFYDVSQALVGFQRSLAITTHLVLNGQVITQAPSLKNAQIIAVPPEEGSWKITALVIAAGTAAYNLGTISKDTPLGNLIHSAYDYTISETLGFYVDYESSLGQQYKELQEDKNNKLPILDQGRFDSVVEKSEVAIKNMHRPIVGSNTAAKAKIMVGDDENKQTIGESLTSETYDYITYEDKSDNFDDVIGRISSYNINTYKGRIYLEEESRPIPFEIVNDAKTKENINLITNSLSNNARDRNEASGDIKCRVYKVTSRTGRLKKLLLCEVNTADMDDIFE